MWKNANPVSREDDFLVKTDRRRLYMKDKGSAPDAYQVALTGQIFYYSSALLISGEIQKGPSGGDQRVKEKDWN